MPSLDPGRPGTKEAYGLSVIAADGTLRIPPKAFAHYRFRTGDLAVAVTTHRGEAGFALLHKARAEASVFRTAIDQLDRPDAVHVFKGKAYALLPIGPETVRLAPALLEAFHLRPGDRLMSVKSTTIALSFTPVEIWRAKFTRRGLHAAVAAMDRLELF